MPKPPAISVINVTIPHSQILSLPSSYVQVVAAVSNMFLVPLFAFIRHDWNSDFGNINPNATLFINVDNEPLCWLTEYTFNGLSDLLAGGQSEAALLPAISRETVYRNPSTVGGLAEGIVLFDNNKIGKSVSIGANNQGSGDFTAGSALDTLSVTLFYAEIPA